MLTLTRRYATVGSNTTGGFQLDTIDTIRNYNVGNAHLTVHTVYDPYADYSYLGKFALWRDVDSDAYVYDMREHLMGEPVRIINGEYRRIWRDARGGIAAEPDTDDSYGGEYRFILPTVWEGEGFHQAWQSATHLDAYARDQWRYIGIVATVSVDGREIGEASIWGIEADWRYDPMRDDLGMVRDTVREALDNAQSFRRTLAKTA